MNVINKLKLAVTNKDWSIVLGVIGILDGIDESKGQNQDLSETRTEPAKPNKIAKDRINLFDGMKFDIDKPDGYDKINDNINRTPRSRNAYKPTHVKCDSCSKEYTVHPSLAREYFICDSCVKVK